LFERKHHRQIASVLEALDAGILAKNGCLFGGGTAIALRNGEYRESVDIDFLVSSPEGYRELRQRLTAKNGIQGIVRRGKTLDQAREVRADQYGVRTLLQAGESRIKFEIIFEGRISLEKPGSADLAAAIEHIRGKPQRLESCMQALQMTEILKALLLQRIESLKRRAFPAR
jgi:Nucleotidyl transferase AbiEii toxin, Type IV TA system